MIVSAGKTPHSVGRVVCVLVHHRDHPPSDRLRRALRVKNVEILPSSEPFAALATYCSVAKQVGVSLAILLLAEPDEIPDSAELAGLANRYVPKGSVWLFTAEPTEQVREVRPSDIEAWSAPSGSGRLRGAIEDKPSREDPPQSVGAVQRGGPTLRIAPGSTAFDEYADEGEPVAGDEPGDGLSDPPESGPILTDEELAMLLADDPVGDSDDSRQEPKNDRTEPSDDEDR